MDITIVFMCAGISGINSGGLSGLYITATLGMIMIEGLKHYGVREWVQIIFLIILLSAGGYLIVYCVYMMTLTNDPNIFLFSIVMFSVGCTAVWFGLSYAEIQETEEIMASISQR